MGQGNQKFVSNLFALSVLDIQHFSGPRHSKSQKLQNSEIKLTLQKPDCSNAGLH